MREVEMQIKVCCKASMNKYHMRDIGVNGKLNVKIDLREREEQWEETRRYRELNNDKIRNLYYSQK